MATLLQPPTQNAVQYTLDSAYNTSDSNLTLNSTLTGVVQAPGVCVIDRVDSSGNATPTKRDYFTFTGVSGTQLTGVTGGKAGSTNQSHSVGAIVEFVPDVVQQQAVYDVVTTEHTPNGVHASLPSVTFLQAIGIITSSQASLALVNALNLVTASQASIALLDVGTKFSVSGASVTGLWPSSASGAVLTSIGNGIPPVYATPSSGPAGTGGLNAVFQVPGNLASQANVGGLIPIPTTFTSQFLNAFVQSPASLASVSVTLLKNNAVVGVIAILAGATYASSASLSNTSLVASDELRININSTASLAADLSVLLRAT